MSDNIVPLFPSADELSQDIIWEISENGLRFWLPHFNRMVTEAKLDGPPCYSIMQHTLARMAALALTVPFGRDPENTQHYLADFSEAFKLQLEHILSTEKDY